MSEPHTEVVHQPVQSSIQNRRPSMSLKERLERRSPPYRLWAARSPKFCHSSSLQPSHAGGDTWFKELAAALEEAERKIDGFSVENLTQDDAFVSAVIEATRSAISTHKDEKRDALRNGLLNIALHRSTDEDRQQTFLRYIDELTVWHLRFSRPVPEPSQAYGTERPATQLECWQRFGDAGRGLPRSLWANVPYMIRSPLTSMLVG